MPDGTAVPGLEAVISFAQRIPPSGQSAGWRRRAAAGSRGLPRAALSGLIREKGKNFDIGKRVYKNMRLFTEPHILEMRHSHRASLYDIIGL